MGLWPCKCSCLIFIQLLVQVWNATLWTHSQSYKGAYPCLPLSIHSFFVERHSFVEYLLCAPAEQFTIYSIYLLTYTHWDLKRYISYNKKERSVQIHIGYFEGYVLDVLKICLAVLRILFFASLFFTSMEHSLKKKKAKCTCCYVIYHQ